MRNFKIGSGEAAMRFNGDDESAAITWNGTESYSITAGGLRLRNVATASLPADPPDGTMVYDTTAQVVKVWDGSAWNAVGNAIAAGSGIDFSANTGTAATGATTTSELFDWYEEGTWTPNLWDNSNSSDEGQTYGGVSGKFTRIGNIVFITGSMTMGGIGTLTSGAAARIGPLPFTAGSGGGVKFDSYTTFATAGDGLPIVGKISGSTNYISLLSSGSSPVSSVQFTVGDFGANAVVSFSGFYFV